MGSFFIFFFERIRALPAYQPPLPTFLAPSFRNSLFPVPPPLPSFIIHTSCFSPLSAVLFLPLITPPATSIPHIVPLCPSPLSEPPPPPPKLRSDGSPPLCLFFFTLLLTPSGDARFVPNFPHFIFILLFWPPFDYFLPAPGLHLEPLWLIPPGLFLFLPGFPLIFLISLSWVVPLGVFGSSFVFFFILLPFPHLPPPKVGIPLGLNHQPFSLPSHLLYFLLPLERCRMVFRIFLPPPPLVVPLPRLSLFVWLNAKFACFSCTFSFPFECGVSAFACSPLFSPRASHICWLLAVITLLSSAPHFFGSFLPGSPSSFLTFSRFLADPHSMSFFRFFLCFFPPQLQRFDENQPLL